MSIILNSKEYSCLNCDKFQRADDTTPGIWHGAGECRALPPAQCCVDTVGTKEEPVFAQIVWAPRTWCAAWKRLIGAALPDPTPIV